MLRLSEPVFYSIQGEGIYAGVPSLFIRLQGCQPSPGCLFCDTAYARNMDGGILVEEDSIVEDCHRHLDGCRVCITGGEPLAQDIGRLVKILKKDKYQVDIETNGCMKKPDWYSIVDCWIADMKCPSSGMDTWCRETDWFGKASVSDQVKFVVGTREDLQYADMVISRNPNPNPWILISPVLAPYALEDREKAWMREVAEFVKNKRHSCPKVRLSLQIHKWVWPRNQRGV